jgi:hypothetical protein
MSRTIKKSVMLAVVVGALAAMAVPSMASAANWSVANVNYTTTGNAGLTVNFLGTNYALACTGMGHVARPRAPLSPTLDITSATGFTCTGSVWWSGCTVTATPTGLPWTADGTSTTNVTINSVNYNLAFSGGSCGWNGATAKLVGTLTGGAWDNTVNARKAVYNSDPGLSVTTTSGFNGIATTSATLLASPSLRLP